jgi:hypothetical protein
LKEALSDRASRVPEVVTAIKELSLRRVTVKQEIDSLERSRAAAAAKPLDGIKDILGYIASKSPEEEQELRLRLRSLVGQLVSRIEVHPFKENQRVNCDIYVYLKPTGSRWILRAADVKQAHIDHPWPLLTANSPEQAEVEAKGPESFVVDPTKPVVKFTRKAPTKAKAKKPSIKAKAKKPSKRR